MLNISIKIFINILIDTITHSGATFLFIILGVIFTIAMIINLKKHKTIGKSLYIIGWTFIIIFIAVKYNSFISKLFDNLVNTVFMQIFFPNLSAYIIVITLTNMIFLITILNKNSKLSDKIINCTFFTSIMTIMIYILDLIMANKINVYQANEVYKNQNILILIETTTIIFSIWMLIIISKFIIKKLIKISNDKIKKEYENANENKQLNENKKIGDYINQTNSLVGKYINRL